jgi:hypothetical protein
LVSTRILQSKDVITEVRALAFTLVVPQVTHFYLKLGCHLTPHAKVQTTLLEAIYGASIITGCIKAHRLLRGEVIFATVAKRVGSG